MNYQDTVRFAMTEGNKRVVCIVSGEVLEDVTHSPGLDNRGRLRAFHAHRSAIEAIASKRYDQGEESPLVRLADLHGR